MNKIENSFFMDLQHQLYEDAKCNGKIKIQLYEDAKYNGPIKIQFIKN